MSKLNEQSCLGETAHKNCLHGEKSSYLSHISPAFRWDLTLVWWIHSHRNDLFWQIHDSDEILLRWDISPGLDNFFHINRCKTLSLFQTNVFAIIKFKRNERLHILAKITSWEKEKEMSKIFKILVFKRIMANDSNFLCFQ